jgi:signal transduction histidine kinase
MSDPQVSGELSFAVDARHIQQLGLELVENQITAVTELVKNAYDADATVVVVRGYGTHRRDGVLLVVDDGLGMTLDDVSLGWMRLSSDGKERSPISDTYRRTRAGRKGIGRFSTQTLASALTLRTTRLHEPWQLSVEFHWDRDYRAGVDLSSITNPYRRVPGDPAVSGTALLMRGLHEPWTQRQWSRVRDAVRLLQPPFPRQAPRAVKGADHVVDPGFRVMILPPAEITDVPSNPFSLLGTPITAGEENTYGAGAAGRDLDDFLSAATATLRGQVDAAGVAHWRVDSDRLDLHDATTAEASFGQTGPLEFQVSYFIYNREALGDVKVRIAQRMGADYGGVRVYRDGLRVMPYGEREDDWLRLDELAASRTVLPPIGKSNVFGAVFITRQDNPRLIDTASREGIVEGRALNEVREVLRQSLIWTALRVAGKRERKPTAGRSRSAPATRTEVLDRAIREIAAAATSPAGPGDAGLRDRVLEVAADVREEAQLADRVAAEHEADLLGEIELLRVLASLGTASSVFSHEVSGALQRSSAAADDVRRALGPGPGSTVERAKAQQDALVRLTTSLAQLRQLSDYVVGYTSAVRRRDRRAQPVSRIVSEFLTAFAGLLDQRSIKPEAVIEPRSLRTLPMARSELEAVLFNLLSNAVKALDRSQETARRIRVRAAPSADGAKVVLSFQDNGGGIDPTIAHQIFEPFVTSSTSTSPVLGTGTGLGLTVVRDLLESYGGSVAVGVPDADMTTNIQVTVPRSSSQIGEVIPAG